VAGSSEIKANLAHLGQELGPSLAILVELVLTHCLYRDCQGRGVMSTSF
jgi:hypothetical protein